MAVAFDWQGVVDTNVSFANLYPQDHSITVRFMTQYPNGYAGPVLAVNGPGVYVIGQGLWSRAPSGIKLIVKAELRSNSPAAALVAGQWHHLAAVRSNNQLIVYLDGNEVSRFPVNNTNGPSGTLRLGRVTDGQKVDGVGAQFFGMMDDLAVYSRALTPAEVTAQAQATSHLTGAESGLIAGWVFTPRATPQPNARLNRPCERSDSTRLVETSANWDSLADARLVPPHRNHVDMELPFNEDEAWQCIQGFSAPGGTHQGIAAFCWDFIIADHPQADNYPKGSQDAPVRVCAPGIVTFVDDDAPQANPPPADRTNIAHVRHGDGQYCGYLHLLKDSVGPSVDDTVETGQMLATVGDEQFTATNPHLHLAVSDLQDGTAGFVTIPTTFCNYEVSLPRLNPDDPRQWVPVGRGVPQNGQVICRSSLRIVDVSAQSFIVFLVPSVWFRVLSPSANSVAVTITVSRPGGQEHVLVSEDPYGGSVPAGRVGAWSGRSVPTNTSSRIFLWWLGKTADGTDFSTQNGVYYFRITAVDPTGRSMLADAEVPITWHDGRITCIRTAERPDPTRRIVGVGGEGGERGRWSMTVQEIIAAIEAGGYFYVEQPEGDRVAVEVAVSSRGRKYIKTVADGDEPNNLLALPSCPP